MNDNSRGPQRATRTNSGREVRGERFEPTNPWRCVSLAWRNHQTDDTASAAYNCPGR